MSLSYDVLSLGDYYLDMVFTGLPALPELGQEIVGSGFDMLPGGAYTGVVAMHRLGLRVGWAADFGNDEFSKYVLGKAEAERLDTRLFVHHRRPLRRITVAVSYPQDRAFITYYDPEPGIPAAMRALSRASARVLYVPGFYAGALFDAGLLLARTRQMKLVMDGNSTEQVSLGDGPVRKSLRAADIFLANAREARHMTGRDNLISAIRELGGHCQVVVVKDGANGAFAYNDGEIMHAPAIEVRAVDTTGAGDCFNAGFIRAWLNRLPLADCLQWANIVGGLSTEARGGTGRVIRVGEVEARLAGQTFSTHK